jgi:hypothetical protein
MAENYPTFLKFFLRETGNLPMAIEAINCFKSSNGSLKLYLIY